MTPRSDGYIPPCIPTAPTISRQGPTVHRDQARRLPVDRPSGRQDRSLVKQPKRHVSCLDKGDVVYLTALKIASRGVKLCVLDEMRAITELLHQIEILHPIHFRDREELIRMYFREDN